jgi:hypothetical protein
VASKFLGQVISHLDLVNVWHWLSPWSKAWHDGCDMDQSAQLESPLNMS